MFAHVQPQVCKEVNGPLLELLAKAINYHDLECLDLLKKGGKIVSGC